MKPSPPDHLATPIELLESYLDNETGQRPFLAIGDYGVGRGYWIERTLRARGLEPLWLYDPEAAPDADLEGRSFFPVYDLPKPELPPTNPSIVLLPAGFYRGPEFRDLDFGVFPSPPDHERERYLQKLGAPASLADGNPTYPSLELAALAFEVSGGVKTTAGPLQNPSWEEYRLGGECPVPEGLLPYYSAYAFPPRFWSPNRNFGYQTKLRARTFRILLEQIRLEWPEGKVPFPEILKDPKIREPRRRTERSASSEAKGSVPPPKDYAVAWD